MPLIDSIKGFIPGAGSAVPTYRCTDCGTTFESAVESGSYWFRCPDCESEDAERVTDA